MKKNDSSLLLLFLFLFLGKFQLHAQERTTIGERSADKINLSGDWSFQIDSLDQGIKEEWYKQQLKDKIHLPGSMTTNGKGNDIVINTPWTGDIIDSSWFYKPEFASYREPGKIKVPFWLQPLKYYKGPAWYQRTVVVPASWKGKVTQLFIERSHWETALWIDNRKIGIQNSLGTPHVFDLTGVLTPGTHQITIRIDNRVKEINVGVNAHSITDHTQTNWNGMVGRLFIQARPAVFLNDIQLYPDIEKKIVTARIVIKNSTGKSQEGQLVLQAWPENSPNEKLKTEIREIKVQGDSALVEVNYPMGAHPLLWDEFHPSLYKMKVGWQSHEKENDERQVGFGMRAFSTRGTQFTINGHLTFLRGTLECAVFPLTGYPATDVETWLTIFKKCKSYGLNHMRFHSWCPPEAAFEAADRTGFYLHIECSSWANQGAVIGDGTPLDAYIYEESRRIVKEFGNHPSFCMMAYGNEPAGKNMIPYLKEFVSYWKQRDPRRLYTTGAGWPVVPESNYNSTPDPRIQGWGQGLKSIINSEAPKTNYDWSSVIAKWQHPTVSHEIGQWCVYPDFKEIKKYTGVLKARNFEIFEDLLNAHGLGHLADSFLLASGKLQALCYKADIEAALRTPGFGGFQLLGLYDFPGQGTALVGVLNAFWEDKGYITGKEFSRFCAATVPLARLPKMVYNNNESLDVPVEIAHFGAAPLENITPTWKISLGSGEVLFQGQLPKTTVPLGNAFSLGRIQQALGSVTQPSRLVLTIDVGDHENTWDFFVYPSSLPSSKPNVLISQQLDTKAMEMLQKGGKVLLTPKKGDISTTKGGNIAIGFSSIFWNTAWTHGQPPHTLGILCDPRHPALKEFPTQFHSNWQWWDAMTHSTAIELDSVDHGLQPIVRVVDDWFTARPLGLIFECKVGKGSLLVSGIDLLTNQDQRPESRQLLFSLLQYMQSPEFHPERQVSIEKLQGLFASEKGGKLLSSR